MSVKRLRKMSLKTPSPVEKLHSDKEINSAKCLTPPHRIVKVNKTFFIEKFNITLTNSAIRCVSCQFLLSEETNSPNVSLQGNFTQEGLKRDTEKGKSHRSKEPSKLF